MPRRLPRWISVRSTRSAAWWRLPSSGRSFSAEREAAELVRQKADLAATLLASLSHDLKTPLTAVRVAVENLRGDIPPADRRVQADLAIDELERLTRLFQDILDMARVDAAAHRASSANG